MTTETSRYAFVTLLTTDAYLPGALVLAHSLRRAHSLTHNPVGTLTPADINNLGPAGLSAHVDVEPKVELVCLVTPATVSVKSVNALLRAFDKVVGVEPLTFAGFAASQMSPSKGRSPSTSRTEAKRAARQVRAESRRKLALLGRPDLGENAGAALTKLHAWRLTVYDKVVFLDADMLVLRPLAHLFSLTSALAASPDIGWPDAFNSGFMVLTPSLSTFSDIRDYAITRGSWDGADQGLLNDYFGGDELSGQAGRGGGWQRLPFRYNVTPNAGYTYTPAYERYGSGIMAAHFIGANKPWNRPKPNNVTSTSPSSRQVNGQLDDFLLRWHEAYEEYYPANRNKRGSAEVVHTERGVEVVERPYAVPTYRAVWDAESEIAASSSESAPSTRKSQARIRGVRRGNSPASLIKGALQTDDLQEMFQDGLVAASIAAELASLSTDGNRSGEGVYIILPLDGRINLMGPDLDSGDEGDSPNSDDTVHASRGTSLSQESQQIWSPPMVKWDPAREPPPKGEGNSEYQMKEPVDAYYVNAWDQQIQPKGKAAFYQTSSVPTSQTRTMEMLQREHYFDNLGSQRPDPSLVKAVFPWESKQSSATSSRIFPDEEPASTVPGSRGAEASLEAGSISPGEASSGSNTGTIDAPSSQTTPSAQRAFSPSSDYQKRVPPSLNYSNAWDRVSAIGAKYDRPKPPVSSTRGIQTTGDEARASRSSQTTSAKYRNRGSQAEVGDWEGGANIGRGLRDASADQSADGDNESSSDSDDEEVEEAGTGKWRREGPGPGYQRKAERHNEQSGATPRSPRSQQYSTLGGAGGGGSRISGDRSRSSSSSGGIPPALVVPGTIPSAATRQRLRAEGGLPFVEEGAVSPSLDMSLSTAYEQVSDSTRWTSPHVSPPLLFSQSSFESGRSTPTALSTTTPSSTSRGDTRKEAR